MGIDYHNPEQQVPDFASYFKIFGDFLEKRDNQEVHFELGRAQVTDLTQQIADQHAENEVLLERNRVLDAEVLELKKGMETVEERARHELGMVKEGETLYQLAQ